MGTVMNGNVWAGACVNGKTVSGLAKNGVVFYRMPVSTYRRRIMVGDNLSNRTIFQDFPDGFYKSGMSDGQQSNLIESNNINIFEYYFGDSVSGTYNVYCKDRADSNLLYRYDLVFGRTMTKKDVTTGTYLNATVTEVNENKTYRHLFIEDKNIRPLKVGDVITSNTKFYFTFPDDFSKKVSPQMMAIISAKYSDNSSAMNLWYSKIASTNNVYFNFYGMSGYSQENVYSTNSSGDVTTNISYKNLAVTSPITISAINNTDIAKYVLVDTTTLGA